MQGVKIIKNSAWMVLQHCYSLVLSMLISVWIVRYLGPENYGKLEYVSSIIAILTTICGMGLSNIMVREMTKQEALKGQVLGSAVVLLSFVSVVVYSLLFFLCNHYEENIVLCNMLRIQGIYLLLQPVLVFKEWFLANLNSKTFVLISISAFTLSKVYSLLLMESGKSVIYFSFAKVIEGLALFILIWGYLVIKKPISISVKFKCMLELLNKSKAYIISDLAIIIYAQIDKIMLKGMMGEYEVGIYSASSYVSTFWQFVPIALINSASPVIIKKYESKKEHYEKDMKRLVLIISLICLGMLAALKIFGSVIIGIVYGEMYQQATNYLLILGGSVFFSMMGCIGSIWIVCNEVSQYSAYRTVLGAILNCILNYFLIDKWGIMGAAFATFITQFMAAVIFTFCFKKTRPILYIFYEAYRDIPKYIRQMVNMIRHR